jgi:hypothetical protein
VSGKESTLAWCKRRAGECRDDSIANSTTEDGRELAAEARVFAQVAKRLRFDFAAMVATCDRAIEIIEGGHDPLEARDWLATMAGTLRGEK